MIDAHIHLDGKSLHPQVLPEADRLGIKKLICSSIANYIHYPTYEQVKTANEDLRQVIHEHPERIAGYCYVNPRHGEQALIDYRRRIESEEMIGLKLWVATLCDDPLTFPFIEASIAYRVPILIHAWDKTIGQLAYESTATHVANLAERYPEAHIIMAHFAGKAETVDLIAPYKNVYTDTSGTPIGYGDTKIAVDCLGVERVIFGSDLSGACLASNIGKVMGAGLSNDDFDLVMGGNMERLLQMKYQ